VDANDNGLLDAGEATAVASQQLGAGATGFSITVPLTQNAANAFVVAATDAAGNRGPAADVPTVTEDSATADTTPPPAPAVSTPSTALTVDADSFVITGTAEAGSLVQVFVDANGNGALDAGEALAASQQLGAGATGFSIAVPLTQNAANEFVIVATDAAGNRGTAADVPTLTEGAAGGGADLLVLIGGDELPGFGGDGGDAGGETGGDGDGDGDFGGAVGGAGDGDTGGGNNPITQFVRSGTGPNAGGFSTPLGMAGAPPAGFSATPIGQAFDGSTPPFAPLAALGESGSVLYVFTGGQWLGIELAPVDAGDGAPGDQPGDQPDNQPEEPVADAAGPPAPEAAGLAALTQGGSQPPDDSPPPSPATMPSFTAQLSDAAGAFDAEAAKLAEALAAKAALDRSSPVVPKIH
jgi:hypothetical protein